jgi:uncharacterized sulfatase
MEDPDSGVRYWGAMGALMRGEAAVKTMHGALTKALADASGSVRIAAAEALGRYGREEDLAKVLEVLIQLADSVKSGSYAAIQSLNAIDALGQKAAPLKARLKALPAVDPGSPARVNKEYTTRLIERLNKTL